MGFGVAAGRAGTDRSTIVRDFLRWYIGAGELPEPPERADDAS